MKLSEHSKIKLKNSLAHWRVPVDFADPLFNYLVYGLTPGSFFTSVLANDFGMAILRSHPGNTIESLKTVVKWVINVMPKQAHGSYEIVDEWSYLSVAERRQILEDHKLIYTSEEETWMILNDTPIEKEPWISY